MESRPRRRKGQGGLFIIRKPAWNEFKQAYEEVDFYRATRDVPDPANPDRKVRVTGTGRTPQEAQDRLQKSITRLAVKRGMQLAGVDVKTRSRGSQSLTEHFEEWYSELNPKLVSTTLRLKYKQHFFNHIIPDLGKVKLPDLDYVKLQKFFYETLPAKRKLVNGVESDLPLLGPNSILNIYRTMSVCLVNAERKGKILRNPLSLVNTPKFVPPKENIPQLGHIVEHMFKKMNEANDPMYDHFLLALLGLRKGERLGITFSSVTLTGDRPKIVVRNQLTRVTGEGMFLKPATKTGKDRTVALTDPWLASLKRLKAYRAQQLKMPGFKPESQYADLVFLKDNGKPYGLNEDNELWEKVNETYNSKQSKIRGHALRHIGATMLADSGVSREVAMAILGHESEAMNHYYARMTQLGQAESLDKVGKALNAKINKS